MIDIQASIDAMTRQNAYGAVKTLEDLHRYAAIMDADEPELIIECGTFSGGSAAWFSQYAPVITIDIDHSHIEQRHFERWKGVLFLKGSTTDPWILKYVHQLAEGKRCFVVLDSSHSAPHVYAEMLGYGDLVPVGGHMTVEDGIIHYLEDDDIRKSVYDGTPLDALRSPTFKGVWELDETIQNMYSQTQHPEGWLKRVA